MSEIPEEAFVDILQELRRKPLDVNKYRNSVGIGRSQAFGVVNKRSLPPDYSRQNWRRPKLFYHLIEFADKYVPIAWNAITVNQNYQAGPHKDKHNRGNSFLVAFGDFTGGELEFHEGTRLGLHDIRHKPVIENFSAYTHSVKDFQGERYSLVFYQFWTPRLPDLPPFSVRIEDGEYFFYRGDEKITEENGLPHPLRGYKRPPKAK
jgi:hypothetical protein